MPIIYFNEREKKKEVNGNLTDINKKSISSPIIQYHYINGINMLLK